MNPLKDRILKLLANTDITGRHRKIFDLYPTNPYYENLAYHNVSHVKGVLNLFEVLRKLSNQGFSKTALRNVETAIAFHDLNHCGRSDPDSSIDGADNISRAAVAFVNWAEETKYPVKERLSVYQLIRATAWPRGFDGFRYNGQEGEYRELAAMMQDADILWGMVDQSAEQCMLGMWQERFNVGLEEGTIDIFKTLETQLKFIQQYEPVSKAGKIFKHVMFTQASETWATVALDYERNLMLATMVSEMPDDEVVKLSKMIPENAI